MIKSMTGYGRSVQSNEGYTFTVEMKAVNHRYKELAFRMSKELLAVEEQLKKTVNRYINRGRVDVYITMEKDQQIEEVIAVNENTLLGYLNAIKKIQQDIPEINGDITVKELLTIPDVFSINKQSIDIDLIITTLEKALEQALMELVRFRRIEGEQLAKDCSNRLELIEGLCENISNHADEVLNEYHQKLMKRIQELLKDNVQIDETRLATEVAIYADKSNIDEELTRLKSHVRQFNTYLDEGETVGRKLDFLVQEMNREVNTIGSKSSSTNISNYVVEIKSELEKIREQVQNIE
ncbi:YicC/YloC family endoribonuclease [Desulfuribacillus alkaliarsenatis]|uniref:YicC family protein n=1 Tax=Desulfuribacillus alkaliarsenatis TaxID=766136 RepID=A0A1E5G5R7_9FIRM|nr:YicC/YloC family endoribonuclease [Desulfuribacillus alkaliarsenatis]OEF98527.1 YicC family protein [Desulfuribacillus alkaliarsenatis]